MDTFSRVRTFDAFPKVDSSHTVRSSRGALSTVATIVCGLLILYSEVGGYLGGYVEHQYEVDKEIRSELTINLDLLVAMPCEYIHTNVRDVTRDRYLAGETLNFEGFRFYIPDGFNVNHANDHHELTNLDMAMSESMRAEFRVQGVRVNEGAPACHIFGLIPVNHVKGDFHITGKGFGYQDTSYVPYDALNFSHVIQEFLYGDFYPFINNPLDFTAKVTEERLQLYKYYSWVVPTHYEQMGLGLEMNQYSLTENHLPIKVNEFGRPEGVPGIYFKYDFEPIKLIVRERRLGFLQFVSRLATILGGLLIVAGYVYRAYERLLLMTFGNRYASRGRERKEGGLLSAEKR